MSIRSPMTRWRAAAVASLAALPAVGIGLANELGSARGLSRGRRPPPRGAAARRDGRRAATGPIGTLGPGAWNWFGDPRAVYVGGRYDEIFAGWLDWSGNVTVGAYHPRSGEVSSM